MRTPRIRRPRLSYANVASTLALVLAVSMGGAYAHGKIGSGLLKNNAVKSRHIAHGHVKTPDIKRNAVTAGKIRGKAVRTRHIRDHAVWGLIGGDGTLIRGHGIADVERDAPGVYGLKFTKAVLKRAVTHSIYSSSPGSTSVTHCSTAHPAGINCNALSPQFQNDPANVGVVTFDAAGSTADQAFLIVAHPRTPGVVTPSPRGVTPRPGGGSPLTK